MIKFSNPVPGSRIQESQFSKTVELFSFPNDSVISPYNGIIVSYDPNNCGGKMKIKHVVNNDTYFSEFCNLISNTSFFSGVQVREGQTIGRLGSNNLEYTIKDGNGDKQKVKDFLLGIDSNKEKKEKKEKEENKLETKTSEDKGYGALGDALLKGMLFPFGMVSSTMEKNKKKDEIGRKEKEEERKKKEEEKKLGNQVSEEIKRIKELLK